MELLFKLLDAYGPSGNEKEVRNLIYSQIKKYTDNVNIDKFGNLVAYKKGSGPKVLLVAHMDEVGLMVKHINDKGVVSVVTVGWLDPISVVGHLTHVQTKKGVIHGITTLTNINNGEEVTELPKITDIKVEFGMGKKELEKRGVQIGTFINTERKAKLLNEKGVFTGKALDDRVGCYILLETARKLKKTKSEVYFVFTVQEEIGLYGAKTSLYKLDPDMAIAVDVTNADDMGSEPTRILGAGPTMTVKDSEMMANECINEALKKLAKKHKLPLQIDVSEFGTTDALSVSVERGGIPTSVLGVPVKNLHTVTGIADFNDIENAVKLLCAFLENPPTTCYEH